MSNKTSVCQSHFLFKSKAEPSQLGFFHDIVVKYEICLRPAEVANKWWSEVMGYSNPPYKLGTDVEIITITKKSKFVRVYDGEISGQFGGWLMNIDDIKGLTPEQIRDLYALPATPKYMTDVIIEPGTKIRTGIVNPLEGWGSGGARQYDLMGQRIGQFINERPMQW